MTQLLTPTPSTDIVLPDVSHIITEDDEPVDNLPSAKQQRLWVEPLYLSSLLRRPFLADSNVGIFKTPHKPAIVPDMFLSLDVDLAEDWWAKEHRSYFIWEFGKPPDVVIEMVSNEKGGELSRKLTDYAQLGIPYYVIYDPQLYIQEQVLQVYELHVGEYLPRPDYRLPKIALALTFWNGLFEDRETRWVRWCDLAGNLLPTGAEQAEQERQRAERLAAKLRDLGIDPDAL